MTNEIRPKDMSDAEREALPEADMTRLIAEGRLKTRGTGFQADDIAMWWDSSGFGWTFGRYHDGSWYKI